MKTSQLTKFVRALTLATTLAFTFAVGAATYYWKGGTAGYGSYVSLENWSTESATGANAKVLPSGGDDFYGSQSLKFDLVGDKFQIASWNPNADWTGWNLSITNGELEVLTSISTHSGNINIVDGGILTMASTMSFTPAVDDAGVRYLNVKKGGTWNFYGKFYGYHWRFTIEDGGEATIDTSDWGGHTSSVQTENYLKNSGTLNLPHGWEWVRGGYDYRYDARYEQQAGATLNLGGPITRASASGKWTFGIDFKGGTVNVTDDAAFVADSVKLANQVDFTVAENKKVEMGTIDYAEGAIVTKSGAGTMVFSDNVPPNLYVWGGTVRFAAPNLTFAGSVSSGTPVTIEIAAKGLTFDASVWDTKVNYRIDPDVIGIGDVILISTMAGVLSSAQESLSEAGVNTEIVGNQLKMVASDVKFYATDITNINNPAGWSNGEVPSAGSSALVSGAGVNIKVEDGTSEIPSFSGLTLAEGATLTLDCENTVVPCPVTLMDGAKLVLVQSAELGGFSGALTQGAPINEVVVPAGTTLKIPGGTKFTNCKLDLKGSIVGTTDGKLVFGYAKVDETAKFTMTAEGATITALNSSGSENASRVEFVCPETGGSVEVTEPIVLKNTTITYNSKDGMAFGVNNPSDKAFTITADGTDLNVGAETVVAGAANLVLKGSRLLRKRHSEGDSNESYYNIVVRQKGKITVDEGGSIYAGVTRVNGNVVDGVIRLDPDEEGFVGIEFLDGGTAHWYKANGLSKGAISFNDSTFEFTKAYWWGWGNRSHLFNGMTAVNIEADKKLTFKCVKETVYSSNDDTYTYFIMEAPFTGAGNLFFTSERSSQQMQPTFVCENNTCTGTLSVDPKANIMVHFAKGANWAGTVVQNGKIDLLPQDNDHKGAAENGPTEVTFGAVELRAPMRIRLWGGETFRSDKINLTGAGWIVPEDAVNACLDFVVQGDYVVAPGDKWEIGTVPVGQDMPQATDLKWIYVTEPIEGDTEHVRVFVQVAALSYVFNSTEITDMNDPAGWNLGTVPKSDVDVTVAGAGVRAEMTTETPNYASVTVKEGATFAVVAERTVNPITLQAGTELDVDISASAVTCYGCLPKREVLVAEHARDIDLADVTYTATMAGTSWNVLNQPAQAAYLVLNGEDGSVIVQFQCADDVYTKAVFVKFERRDNVIYATGLGAYYKIGNVVGTDMSSGATSYTYAESDTVEGYGVKDITLTAPSGELLVCGGTVKANAIATYDEEEGGVVTIDVMENCVLDLSESAIDDAVRIVKKGSGTIVLDACIPTNMTILEGSIGLLPEKEYDLSGLEIAEGVTYMAKTGEAVQPGYPIIQDGKTILKALGTFVGSGSWRDSGNWAGGVIPGAGQTAFITEGSAVVIDSVIPALGTIEMEEETTLTVLNDAALPKLKLAPTAKVLIGNNADALNVSLAATPDAAFAENGDEIVIPVFNVATNVTLTVPGNTFFKNLDMTICGTVTTPENNCGGVRFGYAAKGETSYLKLVCDLAKIDPKCWDSANGGFVGIAYPDEGGAVVPLADIVMTTVTFCPCTGGWGGYRNVYVGANNSQDIDFNVIWDNTKFECTWGTTIGGAAHMFFRNKAYVQFNGACINHGAGNFFITGSATVVFEDETTYLEYCQSSKSVDFSPGAVGFKQVSFKNGARFIQNGVTGNKNAIVTFENGEVVIPNDYRQYDVLNNVGSVAIEADSWLTIKGAKQGQGSDWDRVIKFTNAPITGEGSLMVTNTATGKLMDVTIVNGANTATGFATAAAEEGTYLRFADGANWAGTVVANGHVTLTNLQNGASLTSVTLGNLKLKSGEFPIRFFRDNYGNLSVDTINLTGAVIREEGDTGIIRLTGIEPEIGDKVELGTAPKGAWAKAVIKTASGRTVQVIESEPDEHGLVTATLAVPSGFLIIIR